VKAVFNPKVIGYSKETWLFKEGCLSLPGVWLNIKRPMAVVASYVDENNEPIIETLDQVEGRVWQHEFDHMIGKNFTELASPLKLQLALKALKKQKRK
jgi:peptide deformylase